MAIFSCEYAVLLDCEVFDAVRLDFDNRNLAHLADIARSGQIKIVLTAVVVEEVKSHISREARRVADQLRSAFTTPLVRGYDQNLTARLCSETLAGQLASTGIARFETFLKHAKADVLPVTPVSIDEVLADYFSSQPPFGTGKKKSEFPDAFTLHALRSWAATRKYPTIVVSNDSDLKSFCEANPPLRAMTTLAAFLSIFPDREVAEAVMEWMDGQWKKVEAAVEDQLSEFSFGLEGADGEVEAVRLIQMQVMDLGIVEINKGEARIAADIEVEYEADIYAYPRQWYPEGEGDFPSKESGSVVDYMDMSLDIAVTLDNDGKTPFELGRVEVVDYPRRSRVQVPHDWKGGRLRW